MADRLLNKGEVGVRFTFIVRAVDWSDSIIAFYPFRQQLDTIVSEYLAAPMLMVTRQPSIFQMQNSYYCMCRVHAAVIRDSLIRGEAPLYRD